MTAPTNETDPKTGVSLLGRIFGKVQKAPSPPAGLEDRLSYTRKVGSNGTDAAYWWEGDVPDLDDEYFPTVPEQDKLLVHYDRPPGDENPQTWWEDRTVWQQFQAHNVEKQRGVPWDLDTTKGPEPAPDPRWNPPEVKRPTAFLSPTSYSYTRPYGQEVEHELNGVHFSLADNRRAYVLGGSAGRVNTWNNSYRVDPVTNDATSVFVGDTLTNDIGTRVMYTTPEADAQVINNRSGRLM